MMKNVITICFVFLCFALQAQKSESSNESPTKTEFKGFFVGGMVYTEIYPKPFPIFQLNGGASFKTKRELLIDFVPFQFSYVNRKLSYGGSFFFRKYIKN